jgi:hypothetical protein
MSHATAFAAVSSRQLLSLWPGRAQRQGPAEAVNVLRPRAYALEDARRDVERVIAEWGVLPGPRRLAEAGYRQLANFMARTNREELLTRLGYDERAIARLTDSRRARRKLRWTPERIEHETRILLAGCSEWPPDSFFRRAGEWNLLQAIVYHGGRAHWAGVLGLPLDQTRHPRGWVVQNERLQEYERVAA